MRKWMLLLIIAALALMIAPVAAQEEGSGGIILEGNAGGDPATFNTLLASDTASSRITLFLYPGLIDVDPATAEFRQGRYQAIAESWETSEDGKVITFHLRDDAFWTDGTPVTSADYLYAWNAVKSGEIDTPLGFVLDVIEDVQAPDPQTVQITFTNADCTALNNAGYIYFVPSHVFPEDFSEINDMEFNLNPTVSSGVFMFSQYNPGEQVALVANPDFFGAETVIPAGYIYKNVPDGIVNVEQFLAGETNVIDGPEVSRRDDIRAAGEAGSAQVYDYPSNAWDYLAFNLADPNNPQNGLDEDGNPIDQGHHPLFGDQRVRMAIAQAIDVDAIIQGAVFGEGTRMASAIIPSSWAYNPDLEPIPYDVDAARDLLAEAGWSDEDGDGILEAHGAEYAEDGTPFQFTLYTNVENQRRTSIGTIVQDQLSQVGIRVDFQPVEFNTLLEIQDSQTFDAVILGWRNAYPDDPDLTQLFTPESDIVGSGSNFTSYNNPEVTELNFQARTLPGCDRDERAEIYREIQVIMRDDLPYVWLFAQNGMYAARSNVEGFNPFPAQLFWNVQDWKVTP